MNEEFNFDPERSDAIRQLLIDTVAAAPAKKRHRRIQLSVAIAILLALTASGTAAIALSGGSLFGAPAPTQSMTPVPATTSSTAPSTPTPEYTAEPAPVAVATGPIAPHDVAAAPTAGQWSLTLPGPDERCAQSYEYNIADGYMLFQVGPKMPPADSPVGPCNLPANEVALTMVNTATGEQVWSRDWSWDGSQSDYRDVSTLVLGTSGRVLISSQDATYGPQEVLDLATGETEGAFALAAGEKPFSILAAPGDSGDVIATIQNADSTVGAIPSRVARFDPRDSAHPAWSVPIAGTSPYLFPPKNNLGYTSVQYVSTDTGHYVSAIVNLTTGELSAPPGGTSYDFFTGYTIRPSDYDPTGTPLTLTGLDDDGNPIWVRPNPSGTSESEVLTENQKPGASSTEWIGNGQFVVASSHTVTLVDGASGATVWSTETTDCSLHDGPYSSFYAHVAHDGTTIAITTDDDTSCLFDATTGAPVPGRGIPGNAWRVAGQANLYAVQDGTGTAYDVTTGEARWSMPVPSGTYWFFAGGRLLARDGTTLTSLG